MLHRRSNEFNSGYLSNSFGGISLRNYEQLNNTSNQFNNNSNNNNNNSGPLQSQWKQEIISSNFNTNNQGANTSQGNSIGKQFIKSSIDSPNNSEISWSTTTSSPTPLSNNQSNINDPFGNVFTKPLFDELNPLKKDSVYVDKSMFFNVSLIFYYLKTLFLLIYIYIYIFSRMKSHNQRRMSFKMLIMNLTVIQVPM